VTVLGGGLTGLTAAYRLSKASPSTNITLIDASKRVGGWVDSSKHAVGFKGKNGELVEGEVVLEGGPRTIRPRGSRGAPKMLKLVRYSTDHLDRAQEGIWTGNS
jgi:oxygen-dependent protoporphyrinogen oxidase